MKGAHRPTGLPIGVPRMNAPLPLSDAARRLRRPGGRPRKALVPATGNSGAVAGQASAHRAAPPSMRAAEPTVPVLCPIPPRLLDLAGSAAYLGVSSWTLRDWVSAGVLARVKLPGGSGSKDGDLHRLLFDVRDLDRLVEQGKDDPEVPRKAP
jgi:hypothetical protein